MTKYTVPPEHAGDLTVGVLEVVAHLGETLIRAGVITRKQAVAYMDELAGDIDAQFDREGAPPDAPGRHGRKVAALVLRDFFARPRVGERNFTVIPGEQELPGAER